MSQTLFTLEAVFAKHGDALLLHYGDFNDPRWILIDGGPPSVFRLFLRPHLDHIRFLYDFQDDEPLPLELLMVSHIDEDHIAGVLDLTAELDDARIENRPGAFKVKQLWHNSFDEILGNKGSGHAANMLSRFAATADSSQPNDLPLSPNLSRETLAVIASTAQGRDLRDAAKRLGIPVNEGWRGLVRRLSTRVKSIPMEEGLTFHVLGPAQEEIKKFQDRWDTDLEELQEKEAQAQALDDKSPFNLASISVLAEMQGKKMLLTGDARADHVIEGLEEFSGSKPAPNNPFKVDLLKLPHHGSDKNVDDNFFRSVTADHYVISGDGGFGNPEVATLEMIASARGNDKYTIHFTFPEDPDKRRTTKLRRDALKLVDQWVSNDKPANCTVRYGVEGPSSPPNSPDKRGHTLAVDLLDELYPEEQPIVVTAGVAAPAGAGGAAALSDDFDPDRGERRDFLEGLVYGGEDRQRFTQQSPVMPDVWIHFGLAPHKAMDLLMTPDWNSEPAILARELREQLNQFSWHDGATPLPAIAANQNAVAARMTFPELVAAALPLSWWWRNSLVEASNGEPWEWIKDENLTDLLKKELASPPGDPERRIPADVLWFIRIVGVIAFLYLQKRPGELNVETIEKVRRNPADLVKALQQCFLGAKGDSLPETNMDRPQSLFSVNRNRTSLSSVLDSVPAVKGDAVQRLFDVRGEKIRWAVVDSGIDAVHSAFRRRHAAGGFHSEPFTRSGGGRRRPEHQRYRNNTRVKASYDFTHIRDILSLRGRLLGDSGVPEEELLQWVRDPEPDSQLSLRERLARALGEGKDAPKGGESGAGTKMVDWEALEPFITIEHAPVAYRSPVNAHGTHVAGIMAADWQDAEGSVASLTGMCPELELYDFRVLGDNGTGNEFSIMSAMQFIRHFNSRFEYVAIHGVNLSFSIEHDVSNYACGQTPVCVEAERLVGSGIAVVAAAGNSGRARYLTAHRHGGWQTDEGFRTVSITDPGNAQSVITVGATHRMEPHTYGVSYFSSRGPTGDGRMKPDLVAPGEKIRSTAPGDKDMVLDGTSMAAPHVSGAIALLMSRHTEFIGDPAAVKRILCESATDLGREKYFQGAGLLDILRALQSV